MANIFGQVRSFFQAPSLDTALSELAPRRPEPALRTSWVFDSHVMTEGAGSRGSTPKSTSLAYAERDQWGQENTMRSFMGLTPRERKETLLSIFLANPWASNCIDTIALYIISGGMTIEPRVPNPDKSQRKEIEKLLLRINEDWDFNQYVYDLLTDDMIFGEAFTEYTMRGGVPHQLFSVDCVTMDTEHDRYGRVVKYKQQLNLTSEINYLDKNTIIRWWNPHKRAKVDPFSPLERIQDAILLDKKMVNWMTTFFQKGARFPYWVEFLGDQDEAERYLAWFKQNYTGEKNAHLPPVAYNGAKFHEFGSGALDIDFNSGLDRMLTIVLSAFHVPPSIACIAESGNRLTDMSDGQRKILQYIACDPRRHRFFEKFNYRLIRPYFGEDYYVSTRYADFRDDKSLAEVADIRVKNGTLTQNEVRQEMGREAYTKGGDVAIVWSSKEIVPVPRLEDLENEQRTTAQQQQQQGDLNTEMLKTKVEQAKNPPPPPVMTPGQQAPNQQGATNAKNTQGASAQNKPAQKGTGNPKAQKSETEFRGSLEARLSSTGIQHNGASIASRGTETPATSVSQRAHHRGESIDAQTTQSTSHPQSDARLTSFTQSQNTQTGTAEAGTVRGATTEAGKDHFTGMMLAFMLDPETAKQLAIPDGEAADNLHITLAYLGDMEDEPGEDGLYADPLLRPDTSPEKIKQAVAMIASRAKPLSGTVGGVGRFFPAETEETPVIALVDVPGLVEFRNKLAEVVQAAGYFVANNHGYTPHITLSYIDASEPMPLKSVPALPLTLDTVMLCVGDERIPFKLGVMTQQKQESADDDQQQPDSDKLAYELAAIFLAMQTRGAEHLGAIGALAAYQFSSDEQHKMVDLLADAYIASRIAAYLAAFQAIGSSATWTPAETDLQAARTWATEQVASITSTYAEMFKNASPATPEEAKQFIDKLVEWKPEQIANVVGGTGADAGTRSAVGDMLDALTQANIDTSLIPDGLSADQIRLRVVPEESSSDFCSEYAGKDYALDEADSIPFFPAHPNCQHSLEVYTVVDTVGGPDDEPEE